MCELCLQNPCRYGCPNYSPKETHYYCSECGEMIQIGDFYYENKSGDMCHAGCLHENFSAQDVMYWLGEEMNIMEEN